MIRFAKITLDPKEDTESSYFGFYDTISDTILYFNDEQFFTNKENFEFYAENDFGFKQEKSRYLDKIDHYWDE